MTDSTPVVAKAARVKKQAKKSEESLEELISQRLQLDDELRELDEKRKCLAEKICAAMAKRHTRTAYGSDGRGYRFDSWFQCDFDAEAVNYVRKIKKELLFMPEPLITKSRLENGFKAGHLTKTQHDKLLSFAGKDYLVTRLVSVEAKKGV